MQSTRLVAAAVAAALTALSLNSASAQVPDTTRLDSAATSDTTRALLGDTTGAGPTLTLDDAIGLALKNNPDYLSTRDARRAASAGKRAAYGAFLPGVDVSLQGSYRQSGGQPINGVTGFEVASDIYQSSYQLNLTYALNAVTFLNPKIQSANVKAADADIAGSAQTVRSTVTTNYLNVLASRAKAELQDSLVIQNNVQLELAKAKMAVGSGTQLDVSNAEVALGQAKVAALQAHNQVEIDKLRLFQTMGVRQPADVRLTTDFPVRAPDFTLESVLDLARQRNPALNALRARGKVASLNVKSAQSNYLPTLQMQAGWGGYTYQYANSNYPVTLAESQMQSSIQNCYTQDSLRVGAGLPSIQGRCDALPRFGPETAAQIRAQNNQFPFDFSRQPFQVSAFLSLPIFDGFQREQRIEEAKAQRNSAQYNVRKQELALTGDVTADYLQLVTNAKVVEQQERNAATARQQLELAQERYRVGAADYLELANARATYAQAENDRINAIYQYHISFAQLENAVGRPLR
ncbi:MAG TPA: TolC family protein [Gemmatimonadaceae bacterium]|nr:TolC family protein [Gemmatimonadaceae bacterium]